MPCRVLFQITKIQAQNSHPHDVFDHLLMDHGMISPRDILQQQAAARPQQLATMQRSQIGERMDRAQGRKAARRSQPSACTPVGETATQSLRLDESASKVPSACASVRNAVWGETLQWLGSEILYLMSSSSRTQATTRFLDPSMVDPKVNSSPLHL